MAPPPQAASPAPKAPPDGETHWTIAALLTSMQTFLTRHHISDARLDAEVLLGHVLGVSRIYLYTHFDQPVTADERTRLRGLVKRRAAHEPVAYLLGHKEFYSRDFAVDARVLIPRPETEHVVESVLAWAGMQHDAPLRVLDIGCGSGALAVTLAHALPHAVVYATDISADALAVARCNAETHQVTARITFFEGDLFDALPKDVARFDIIVSNPPYIAETDAGTLARDVVAFEPKTALFGGPNGLLVLRRLCAQARAFMTPQSLLAMEMGFDQRGAVHSFVQAQAFDDFEVVHDLQGHPRVALARVGPVPKRRSAKQSTAPDDQRDDHGLAAIDDAKLPTFDVNDATVQQRS